MVRRAHISNFRPIGPLGGLGHPEMRFRCDYHSLQRRSLCHSTTNGHTILKLCRCHHPDSDMPQKKFHINPTARHFRSMSDPALLRLCKPGATSHHYRIDIPMFSSLLPTFSCWHQTVGPFLTLLEAHLGPKAGFCRNMTCRRQVTWCHRVPSEYGEESPHFKFQTNPTAGWTWAAG